MSVGAPSGTVTFLFTDLEDSTRLWEERPDAMRRALGRHDSIVKGAIDDHHGYVFSTGGDGFGAAFSRSADAVAAAATAQRSLMAERWPDGVTLRVRMGLHTGEAEERDGDYFGPPLNRAARLTAAAHGGQIVVSEVTAELLAGAPGLALVDLGSHRLRGLVEAMRVFGVKAEGLDWVDAPLATAGRLRGNLPRPVTGWFGSKSGLGRHAGELSRHRIVTLTGPGGVGKTRLAIELGALVAADYPDGVWMVELGAVGDPDAAHPAVATTLGVTVQEGFTLLDAISGWLEGRRLLLIVDNCEHLLGPVAELVTAVVRSCDSVTMLATSREPLAVQGEWVVAVPSLGAQDAIGLFYDRAGAGGLARSAADRQTVTSICERLDGIPLAIELAAARTRSLTPADLLARLSDRFRVLRGGARGATERHQTLRATVAWSYRLLASHEQTLFDRLSAFAGGFDLAAAEAVCSGTGIEETDVVELLAGLVDKSLVVADRSGSSTRYRLLETLRQYAEERLDERDESASVRLRHLSHYLGVAYQAHELLTGPNCVQGAALARREWDNFRAAHASALDTDDLTSAQEILAYTYDQANADALVEWIDWAERTIALGDSVGRPDAATFGWATEMAWLTGDYDGACELARRGIASAADPHAPETLMCWAWGTIAHLYAGRLGQALEAGADLELVPHATLAPVVAAQKLTVVSVLATVADRSSLPGHVAALNDVAVASGSPVWASTHAMIAGATALAQDPPDTAAALDWFQRGLAIARATDNRTILDSSLLWMTVGCPALDVAGADGVCSEAVSHAYETRSWSLLWTSIVYSAAHLVRRGRNEVAATVKGYLDTNQPGVIALCVFLPAGVFDAIDGLPYAAARRRGADMQRADLVEMVLSALMSKQERTTD